MYSISAERPELAGASDFNLAAVQIVQAEIAAFKQNIQGLPPVPLAGGSTLIIRYGIVYASSRMISIKFSAAGYIDGAAHGYNATRTLNYQIDSARVLRLADLFRPGVNYLTKLADFSRGELAARFGENFWEAGVAPVAENYRSWNLTAEGLVTTFDPYQIISYAAGEQTVTVPWDSLQDILRSEFQTTQP